MPPFDSENAYSVEVPVADALRARLSECERFQQLTQTTSAADALVKVYLGPGEPPLVGDTQHEDELRERVAWALIYPNREEGGWRIDNDEADGQRADESGLLHLDLRWLPSEQEIAEDGMAITLLWFWDIANALAQELWNRCKLAPCPRLQSIRRDDLGYVDHKQQAGKGGARLDCDFTIAWGEPEQ